MGKSSGSRRRFFRRSRARRRSSRHRSYARRRSSRGRSVTRKKAGKAKCSDTHSGSRPLIVRKYKRKKYTSQCAYFKASSRCRHSYFQKRCQRTCVSKGKDDRRWSRPYFGFVTRQRKYKSRCAYHQRRGHCKSSWIRRNCQRTCLKKGRDNGRFSRPYTRNDRVVVGKKTYPSRCAYYKKRGSCKHGFIRFSRCRRTCGACHLKIPARYGTRRRRYRPPKSRPRKSSGSRRRFFRRSYARRRSSRHRPRARRRSSRHRKTRKTETADNYLKTKAGKKYIIQTATKAMSKSRKTETADDRYVKSTAGKKHINQMISAALQARKNGKLKQWLNGKRETEDDKWVKSSTGRNKIQRWVEQALKSPRRFQAGIRGRSKGPGGNRRSELGEEKQKSAFEIPYVYEDFSTSESIGGPTDLGAASRRLLFTPALSLGEDAGESEMELKMITTAALKTLADQAAKDLVLVKSLKKHVSSIQRELRSKLRGRCGNHMTPALTEKMIRKRKMPKGFKKALAAVKADEKINQTGRLAAFMKGGSKKPPKHTPDDKFVKSPKGKTLIKNLISKEFSRYRGSKKRGRAAGQRGQGPGRL